MRIKILHKTTYLYNKNVPRLSQSLRLYPTACKNQSIINWSINVDRGKIKYLYKDSLGHRTYSLTNKNIEGVQNIIAKGEIETKDFSVILKGYNEKVSPQCFIRYSDLTNPSNKIITLSKKISDPKDHVSLCHQLNQISAKSIKYQTDSTSIYTSASESLEKGRGVCQDFAHILITLARYCGMPARYINGFLYDKNNSITSSHAWAEIFIEHLGWVGFDPTYHKCTDQNYVRVCAGFDSLDASTIRGTKTNYDGDEELMVDVSITEG